MKNIFILALTISTAFFAQAQEKDKLLLDVSRDKGKKTKIQPKKPVAIFKFKEMELDRPNSGDYCSQLKDLTGGTKVELKKYTNTSGCMGWCKDCAGFLREHFGESKRINGSDTWRVPMKPESCSIIDDDNY